MKTKAYYVTLAIFGLLFLLLVALNTFLYWEPVFSHSDCQYPGRPLINGNCDNSDPATPWDIKANTPPIDTEIVENEVPAYVPAEGGK